MELPTGDHGPDTLNAAIAAFVNEKCLREKDGRLKCMTCGSNIEKVMVIIVLCYKVSCDDNGKEIDHPLPYCPNCEEKLADIRISLQI